MYDWAELRHFRYLLAIFERGGFRAASEHLHTAQPNLSVQAKQFQENACIRLFQKRKSGRIRPTETGTAFIPLARLLLETRNEVIDALIAIERGEIRVARFGCAPLVDQTLFRSFCSVHREILPSCSIRPTHADPAHLAEEILSGAVDAAIVTLPIEHSDLRIEEIRSDRLVVCLRRDSPLAKKTTISAADLQAHLTVLYRPQGHPDAHEMLLKQLAEAGVLIEGCSLVSHPSEMQILVKDGYGVTLIRDGMLLDEELTTRPISGVDWSVSTAVIYHKHRHLKTIPLVIKKIKQQFRLEGKGIAGDRRSIPSDLTNSVRKPPHSAKDRPVQLALLSSGLEKSVDELQ